MICGKCGETLEDGAKFCGHCGWKVEVAEPAPVAETAERTEMTAELFEGETPVEEPAGKTEAEAPKEKKKINKMLLLIPIAVLVLAGIIIGIVCFVNSLKREQVDLSGVVSFEVKGYSGYGEAKLVIDEDALEDTYGELISDHTKVRWSKFVREVDLLEYEVTDLTGLSNGDKITLTWEYDKDKASEEYKVDILGESVVYTVTGLTEIKKIDPFEDFEVTFSGVSGDGYADVYVKNYEDYLNYFWYETSERYGLSNGDEVTITFDVAGNRDWVRETYGYELSPAEKTYIVSGLTEYVSRDDQVTDANVKLLMTNAENEIYAHVNDYWDEEASVKALECVGHFISQPDDMGYSTKNVIGLIYKVNANIFVEGRNLDVEHYYPVMFKNVILLENGAFSYDEDDVFCTYDRFAKQFEPANEADVNVPGGSWLFYGYETKEAMEEEYSEYVTGWTVVETENFVYKDYTEAVNGQMKKDFAATLENIKAGDPEALIADAISEFMGTTAGWQETASVNDVTCVNTMLYCSDIISESVPNTCYDVVLEVDAKVVFEDMEENFPFYYVVRYQNVSVDAEGKLTADYSTRMTVNGEFTKMLGEEEVYTGWFSPAVNVWRYYGYQTLDEALAISSETRMNHIFYRRVDSVSRVEEPTVTPEDPIVVPGEEEIPVEGETPAEPGTEDVEVVAPAEATVISPEVAENTWGETLWKAFVTNMNANPSATALDASDLISVHESIVFMAGSMEVVPGYLSGFDNVEITGFKSGAMFAPMIGSIPFVGYVFELEEGADVNTFIDMLAENSNPSWNICVTADQTVVGAYNNMVFFLMCPNSNQGE